MFDDEYDDQQGQASTPSPTPTPAQAPAQLSLDKFEDRVAKKFQIPKGLRKALAETESGGSVNAVSGAGARGRYQVMPSTAKRYGMDASQPFDNVYSGLRYLREKYDQVDPGITDEAARWKAALAGYHGGERQIKNINRTGGNIASGSDGNMTTSDYADRIMKRWAQIGQQERATASPSPTPSPTPAQMPVGSLS